MSENSSSEWARARGEKWLVHLARTEATLDPVDEPLLRAARLDAPCRIAEIGCGGGGTTLKFAERAPAGSVAHGYDISAALVDAARERAASRGDSVAFVLGDTAALPAPPVLYDRLVSRFGIMFFDDPAAAFANLGTWVAPGGRCAFAIWGPSDNNPWIASVRAAVAEVIDLPKPDPEAPGPFRYAGGEKLRELLEAAGFAEIEVEDWREDLPVGGGLDPREAAAYGIASFGSSGGLLEAAGAEAIELARQALKRRYAASVRDGAVWMPAHVQLVTGVRAG